MPTRALVPAMPLALAAKQRRENRPTRIKRAAGSSTVFEGRQLRGDACWDDDERLRPSSLADRAATLIEQRGADGTILEFLAYVSADCPRRQAGKISDLCAAMCTDLPRVL